MTVSYPLRLTAQPRIVRCPVRSRHASSQLLSASSPLTGSLSTSAAPPSRLLEWLDRHQVKDLNVSIRSTQIDGRFIDRTVASKQLKAGETVFSLPSKVVVTLDRVFEDDTLAELLTTDKLSELACLTLYMMYEKKNGRKSFWHCFIKELDRLRAIGQQGAESPVLWPEAEAAKLLKGSPVLSELKERIRGIEQEYLECDTVWYLAGSLFNVYPYDIPTECFTRETFKQAFAAIQATVVHLQNVPLSRRFALVPLGPPLMTYSSTSKALLKMSEDGAHVELVVDRDYEEGEPIYAWCGPQPNRRLLINYGIVDENNPYDALQLTASLRLSDPLFQRKRTLLLQHGFAAQKQRTGAFPAGLIPFLRVAFTSSEGRLSQRDLMDSEIRDGELDGGICAFLCQHFRHRLGQYASSIEGDVETLGSADASAREKVAASLLKIEKEILHRAIRDVLEFANVESAAGLPPPPSDAPVSIAD